MVIDCFRNEAMLEHIGKNMARVLAQYENIDMRLFSGEKGNRYDLAYNSTWQWRDAGIRTSKI